MKTFATRPLLQVRNALIALIVACAGMHSTASAQQLKKPVDAVQVGIAGHYRVGCWTALRVTGVDTAKLIAGEKPTIVETLDGDGVRVQYAQENLSSSDRFGYLVPGSEAAPLIIRDDRDVLHSTRFPVQAESPSRPPSAIPLGMPWIVSIGDPMGIDQIGANEMLDRDASVAVSIADAKSLPDASIGYDGVDLIVISSQGHELLGQLSDDQSAAIQQWVTGGGRLLVTAGATAQRLIDAAPWLTELIPLRKDDLSIRTMEPSAIETYTSTQNPLDNFDGVVLPKSQGRVLITGRTTRRVSTPLATEYIAGLGRVTVIAADLDGPVFATWPERMALITRLIGPLLIPDGDAPMQVSRATAFDDLAGQMRASLDQFTLKRKIGFSVVALILMALIAAIGPLDYLLINRVLGRPLLGWLTFPIVAIGLSAILINQSRPVTAETTAVQGNENGDVDNLIRCNRIEFVDIDSVKNVGRGFAWSHIYSHPASQLDVNIQPGAPISGIASSVESVLTAPFGYPGRAFGGIQIDGGDDRFREYHVTIEQTDETTRGEISGLSLAPRSSKSIATRFSFTPALPDDLQMTRRAGSELLQGELTNPFPFDVLDGMLVYQNWVYLLPTRFPVDGKIASVDSLRQKNFRWQLSRQTALEKSKTQSEQWMASRFDRPRRVAEMLMFHGAVGGSRYTMLRDDPLSFLDLSHLLTDDRCVFIGRLNVTALNLGLVPTSEGPDGAATTPKGQTVTMIRLVIPVETVQR